MKQLKNLIISAIISIGFVSFLQILQPYSVTEVKLKLPKPIADETAEISDENVIVENPKPVKYQKRIEILAWNSYWLWSDFGFKLLPKCSYQNCNLTTDKKRIYTSDAILIHGHGFGDAKGLKRSLATFKNDYRPLIAYFNRESAQ